MVKKKIKYSFPPVLTLWPQQQCNDDHGMQSTSSHYGFCCFSHQTLKCIVEVICLVPIQYLSFQNFLVPLWVLKKAVEAISVLALRTAFLLQVFPRFLNYNETWLQQFCPYLFLSFPLLSIPQKQTLVQLIMDILPLMAIPLLYYHQQNEHGSHENLHVVLEMLSYIL